MTINSIHSVLRIEEFKITPSQHQSIGRLIKECFPDFPADRNYYKQVPSFRYLVQEEEEDTLVGHMGVEHRKINVGGMVTNIFGVSDICVAPKYQSRNIASDLLKQLEQLARSNQIEFIVLVANDYKLYEKNGFELVNNTCRWLMINKHQTLGVNHKNINSCLMIKALSDKKWNDGLVDFLGYIF